MRFLLLSFFLSLSAFGEQRFQIEDGQFKLDGRLFQIRAGEIHYPRVPRADWRHRFQLAKAMGLNTLAVYVFWNVHEEKPGVFDFSGENDVAEFVREAQQEGLYVMLRPGPFSCAEWDLGGYPAWLLKDRSLKIRTADPKYLKFVRRWFKELGKKLAPLQLDRGGPILTVQLENEYLAMDETGPYLPALKQILFDSGFTDAVMVSVDPDWALKKPAVPNVLELVNFGPGGAKSGFEKLASLEQDGPMMTGEYWTGWFDFWGGKHHLGDTPSIIGNLAFMMKNGYSFNFYMFQGGTTFGWRTGADLENGKYAPYVNSYDYDAPVSEGGLVTPKFLAIRELIQNSVGELLPQPPPAPKVISISETPVRRAVSLWKTLPTPIRSARIQTMEDVGQAYGYILYRHVLKTPVAGNLIVREVRDYARVYLDGRFVGTIDRRLGQDSLRIETEKANVRLDILVENMGRVNYGEGMKSEWKGITESVSLMGIDIGDWQIFPLPMASDKPIEFSKGDKCSGPCFFEATFSTHERGDTYLDMTEWEKGEVWINGHMLGRFWPSEGPQQRLYLPGAWLKSGRNVLRIFDIDGRPGRHVQGFIQPSLGPSA